MLPLSLITSALVTGAVLVYLAGRRKKARWDNASPLIKCLAMRSNELKINR